MSEAEIFVDLFCIAKPKFKQQLLKLASAKHLHYITEIIFNFILGNISNTTQSIITKAKRHKKDLLLLIDKKTSDTLRRKIIFSLHSLVAEILSLHKRNASRQIHSSTLHQISADEGRNESRNETG